jgi:hypothetical protein
MPHLRLVEPDEGADETGHDDRPRVSLRLLMAASGRCSCDDCLLAYRAGNKNAGIIRVASSPASLPASSRPQLAAVR